LGDHLLDDPARTTPNRVEEKPLRKFQVRGRLPVTAVVARPSEEREAVPRLSAVPPVQGWVDRQERPEVVSALAGRGSGVVAVTTGFAGRRWLRQDRAGCEGVPGH
jgi:hypothetical protein